jgi:hypothetical protein
MFVLSLNLRSIFTSPVIIAGININHADVIQTGYGSVKCARIHRPRLSHKEINHLIQIKIFLHQKEMAISG